MKKILLILLLISISDAVFGKTEEVSSHEKLERIEYALVWTPIVLFVLQAAFWRFWLSGELTIRHFLTKHVTLASKTEITRNDLGDNVPTATSYKDGKDFSSSRLVMITSALFTYGVVSCLLSYYFYWKFSSGNDADLSEINATLITLGVGILGPYAAGKVRKGKS